METASGQLSLNVPIVGNWPWQKGVTKGHAAWGFDLRNCYESIKNIRVCKHPTPRERPEVLPKHAIIEAMADATGGIQVNPDLVIPPSELEMRASRASGAGGQHVNKTSSRIENVWHIRASQALTDDQHQMLESRLASRISDDGSARVVASDTRSQARNRERAEQRLGELIARSLIVQK